MMQVPATALRGSYVPIVTPFGDGDLDLDAFEVQIERQIDAGSDGLVITGTTGEPTSLTTREREELYRRAVQVAGGRIGVVAATGASNQAETLRLTESATKAGVDAVLVVVPAFVRPSQEGLRRHFVKVAASTDLPFLIYNIPGRAAAGIDPGTVERVALDANNLVGLKSAVADLDPVTDLIQRLGPEFRLFCGVESLSYPFLALGGAGLMSAVANLFPDQVVALCRAVERGDHESALDLHRRLFPINQAVFFEVNPVPLKAMLELAGIGSGEVRPPLSEAAPETVRRLREILDVYERQGRQEKVVT
jgi:4-hydroxy-tetrahydrodipicolinate synthase